MGITNFDALEVGGVPTMGMAGLPLTTGNVFFVDYVNGNDGNTGAADSPMKTVYVAYAACTSGRGDIVAIVGNGAASGTQRLSVANAQVATPAATTGTLTWAKDNTHLVGLGAPTRVAQRARFAPPTGTYTQSTFGSGNFVVVTGNGCIFQNFSLFNGFSTGGTNQICWTDNGSRNYYNNVNFGGMADATSAADAGSRSLKIGSAGSGENTFVNCVIGLDTVARGTAANASLEFAGGTPRNTFVNCTFPVLTTGAGVLSVLVTGAAAIDRWQQFDNCMFINGMSSTGVAQTVIVSMTSASPGGLLFMNQCAFNGDASTNWGDTNALANMWINMAAPSAGNGGVTLKPT
jgi:hypothetical protein